MARPALPPAPPIGWGPRPAPARTVVLGSTVLDVSREAAVVGRVGNALGAAASREGDGTGACEAAVALVTAGAAAVELAVAPDADPGQVGSLVAALVERLDVPLIVAVEPPGPLEVALAAGAVAAVVGHRPTEQQIAAVAEHGASLLVPGEGSTAGRREALSAGVAAVSAGMPAERVLLEVGAADGPGPDVAGVAVVVSDPVDLGRPAGDDRGDRSAALALGIALGGRLLRTTDVRVARRTLVALAAIEQARYEWAT